MTGAAHIIQGNALALPLGDASVDLVVTSPPYFGLRSYQDGCSTCSGSPDSYRVKTCSGCGETTGRVKCHNGCGVPMRWTKPDAPADTTCPDCGGTGKGHYAGQIGSEPTPAEFVDALISATREMVRVLKPSGSIFVNLGDRYEGKAPGPQGQNGQRADRASADEPNCAKRGERLRRARAEQFTREDAAWLAGVIDSDGSIGIHINKQPEGRAPSFVPWVRIGQMRPEVVERAAEICGTGKVIQDGRGCWHWAASAQQSRWVLERIHPWLLIKKRQAWAAIEVARHVEERNAKGSWRQLTDDDIAYRMRLREAVLRWNSGEDDDCHLPEPLPVSLPIYPLAAREKSLLDIPHWYAQECVGRLGLILRAEIIWAKPNGLPESVTDRVRRSHEQWFHLVKQPRYFSAVDEIREPHIFGRPNGKGPTDLEAVAIGVGAKRSLSTAAPPNPLGKLPGSVWSIPTQPLTVPPELGIDHFAAFPMEWPRRIIQGWSPRQVCTACGEGRRPVVDRKPMLWRPGPNAENYAHNTTRKAASGTMLAPAETTITGYACACPDTTAPATPGVILDPFGGTGTTALLAKTLGRTGISVDMSADYCRLAEWRTNDPGQMASALQIEKPEPVHPDQLDLFEETA